MVIISLVNDQTFKTVLPVATGCSAAGCSAAGCSAAGCSAAGCSAAGASVAGAQAASNMLNRTKILINKLTFFMILLLQEFL
ncbi:MAG: hypothetical protein CVU40_05130 [Chloroflexi bacterium HGW-Chloroflexi-2]|nr:MAG: hypothetical protein CVU40_05130 [Chloroflexi bacterium HGW-Chloroflexi-2]